MTGFWGGGAISGSEDFAESRTGATLTAKGMDDPQATAIGALAAPFQAAVESLSNSSSLAGFLPFRRLLPSSRSQSARAAGWARAT